MSSQEKNATEARWIYSVVPKWLEFSGVRQAFGRKKSLANVFIALIKWDHQLDGESMLQRRWGEDWRAFSVCHPDVAMMANVDTQTVGRAATTLLRAGLLDLYQSGQHKRWSRFQINRKRLLEVFRYVVPRLRKMHGGIQNATPNDGALRKTIVYGNKTPPEPLAVDAEEMLGLWKQRLDLPEWPDPDTVAEILGTAEL